MMRKGAWRTIVTYGLLLAALAIGLQWLEFQYLVRTHATQAYVALVALGFLALGIWAGTRLVARRPRGEFVANTQVLATLGITERERQVLELLAAGHSNKEIARQLELSPNTVKTHIGSLFAKLDARRRTDAIRRARELGMIR